MLDLEKSQAFYAELLGVSFARHGATFAFAALDNLTVVLEKSPDQHPGLTAAVSFEVDNLEQMVANLKRQGVKVNQDVTNTPQGKVADLTDLDGNPLELVQRS